MFLRKLKSSDILDIYAIYSNPNVTYPAGFKPITAILEVDDVINILYKNNDLAIVYDNKVIGIIGLDKVKENLFMLGFLLNEKYWSQGLGTKACQLYLNQLKEMNYHTIYADCFINNIASQKLLLKLGFEFQNSYMRSFSGYDQPQHCYLYKKEL